MGWFNWGKGNNETSDDILDKIRDLEADLRDAEKDCNRTEREMWSLKGQGYDGGDPIEIEDIRREHLFYAEKIDSIKDEIRNLERQL